MRERAEKPPRRSLPVGLYYHPPVVDLYGREWQWERQAVILVRRCQHGPGCSKKGGYVTLWGKQVWRECRAKKATRRRSRFDTMLYGSVSEVAAALHTLALPAKWVRVAVDYTNHKPWEPGGRVYLTAKDNRWHTRKENGLAPVNFQYAQELIHVYWPEDAYHMKPNEFLSWLYDYKGD